MKLKKNKYELLNNRFKLHTIVLFTILSVWSVFLFGVGQLKKATARSIIFLI